MTTTVPTGGNGFEAAAPPSSPHAARRWDPLAGLRAADGPDIDVFVSGMVFLDIVFTGLPTAPKAGTEVWTSGMGSAPGGIANFAIASARLGLRTSLAAGFGDDIYGDYCWRTLQDQEGVDLSRSRRFPGWHSPVTASIAVDRDRSMITHGHELPISVDDLVGDPPPSLAVFADLASGSGEIGLPGWARRAGAKGALVFVDAGWDPSGLWNPDLARQLAGVHAFLPNEVEAMAYTRTQSPDDALRVLAEWVPLAVVTRGADGAMAIDATTGEQASVPAPRVDAIDPTGAGDVFDAGFMVGTLAGWPLRERLLFATLCAALAVTHVGSSLAAPGWADIVCWWKDTRRRARAGDGTASELAASYGFLEDLLPPTPVEAVNRAHATLGRSVAVARNTTSAKDKEEP
ncbi:MAG TPA: carbohydrate kinase family protein [Actinopolymorphaceae bacterium]